MKSLGLRFVLRSHLHLHPRASSSAADIPCVPLARVSATRNSSTARLSARPSSPLAFSKQFPPRLEDPPTPLLSRSFSSMAQAITRKTPPLGDLESAEGPATKRARVEITEAVAESQANGHAGGEEEEALVIDESTLYNHSHKSNPKKKSKSKSKKRKEPPPPDPGSASDVLNKEVEELLGPEAVDAALREGLAYVSPYAKGEEVVVRIVSVGSGGTGLAAGPVRDAVPSLIPTSRSTHPPSPSPSHSTIPSTADLTNPNTQRSWALSVPFALPNELVRVRINRHERLYSSATLVEVIEKNEEWRDDARVGCQYFGKCGGCQYQMLSSEKQLQLKRDVIVRAYKTYSSLADHSIPKIQPTVASPLKYAYRTKITPHFERPPKYARPTDLDGGKKPEWLNVGFNVVNSNETMDIEECPIATEVLNERYKRDRVDIMKNIFSYKKGVSLMYRDSLDTSCDAEQLIPPPTSTAPTPAIDRLSDAFSKHLCVTDQKATAREMVGDYLFEYQAGGFFQNNNSVMPLMVDYVRGLIVDPSSPTPTDAFTLPKPTHLVDTYCGSGLFAISLSSHFSTVAGIELSSSAIASAKRNASLNHIPASKISFLAGEAQNIFSVVSSFPPLHTVVVIDPPRKGCDERFVEQLLAFRPGVLVYVSCNVHTQARDVGMIVGRTEGDGVGRRYRLDSLRGFDLFPQTAHVEGVAALRLY